MIRMYCQILCDLLKVDRMALTTKLLLQYVISSCLQTVTLESCSNAVYKYHDEIIWDMVQTPLGP